MRWLVVPVLTLMACGGFIPDTPDSKLNNDDGTDPLNTTPNNGQVVEGDWDLWGTVGPANRNPESPGGNALCTLEDVRTDDLVEVNDATVPGDGWESVVPGGEGRCGDDFETLAWRLMNCERVGQNTTPLECDRRMVWLGREHTLDMIERDFFAHDNPDGETLQARLERHGVDFSSAAENLAEAQDVLESHYSWMDSRGHRGNILGDYTHAGVGSEFSGDRLISTTVFLTP